MIYKPLLSAHVVVFCFEKYYL